MVAGWCPEAVPGPSVPQSLTGAGQSLWWEQKKCYSGSSPMPSLGFVPSKLAFTNASPAHRPALSLPHPQWAVAGILGVAFLSSPSPESLHLPEQRCPSAIWVLTTPCTVDHS